MKLEIIKLFYDYKKKKVVIDQRLTIFFFCLLLSSFFWLLSALSEKYTTTIFIEINQLKDVPNDFLITEELRRELEVQVVGTGFDLLGERLGLREKKFELSFKEAKSVNQQKYAFVSENFHNDIESILSSGLSLKSINQDSIFFNVQRRGKALVKVKPQIERTFKAGYRQSGELTIVPDEVEVFGPEELVDSLTEILTESIVKSNLMDSTTLMVQLDVKDFGNTVKVNPKEVQLSIPVEKFTEKKFTLPIQLINKDSDLKIRLFPDQVNVFFTVPLNKYETFELNSLKAEVSYQKDSLKEQKLKVYIKGAPNYAELIRIVPERVEFIVIK